MKKHNIVHLPESLDFRSQLKPNATTSFIRRRQKMTCTTCSYIKFQRASLNML